MRPKKHCLRGHALNEGTVYIRKDGHRECRECVLLRVSKWSKENREQRRKTHKIFMRDYRKIESPIKAYARRVVSSAIKSGRLKKSPCVKCGCNKTQGHHPDYSKPLNVIWLCSKHHCEMHQGGSL